MAKNVIKPMIFISKPKVTTTKKKKKSGGCSTCNKKK